MKPAKMNEYNLESGGYMSVNKFLAKVAIILTIFCLIFLPGCEGDQGEVGPAGPTGPPGDQGEEGPTYINIAGILFEGSQGALSITNAPSIPKVKINEQVIPFSEQWLFGGARLGYRIDSLSSDVDSFFLEVDYTMADGSPGQARAAVINPGMINLISPPAGSYDVGLGEGIDLVWNSAVGDGYLVVIEGEMNYYDTLGASSSFAIFYDTLLSDTTFSVSGSMIFPDTANISSINFYECYVYVMTLSGVWRGPAVNNISGEGQGIFSVIGMGQSIDVNLVLAGPAISPPPDHDFDLHEYLESLVFEP